MDFVAVQEDVFRDQAVTDYLIMNPVPATSERTDAYFKLPCEGIDCWVHVDYRAASGFMARFQRLITKSKNLNGFLEK